MRLGEIFIELKLDNAAFKAALDRQKVEAEKVVQEIEKASVAASQRTAQKQASSDKAYFNLKRQMLNQQIKYEQDLYSQKQRTLANLQNLENNMLFASAKNVQKDTQTKIKQLNDIIKYEQKQYADRLRVANDYRVSDIKAQQAHAEAIKKNITGQMQTWQKQYDAQIRAEKIAANERIAIQDKAAVAIMQANLDQVKATGGVVNEQTALYNKLTRGIEQARLEYNKSLGPMQSYLDKSLAISQQVLRAAPGFAIATAAIASVYRIIRALRDEFIAGLKAVEDYQVSVATMAAFLTTFDKTVTSQNLTSVYRGATNEAKKLVTQMEILDARTVASGRDLTIMAEQFIKGSVKINIANRATRDGFVNIANALKLLTQGQNQEIQMRQEIRALTEGQLRDSNILVKTLQSIDPQIKEHIKLWRQEGTLIENIGALLSGFGPAAKDLENNWVVIGSTMSTIHNRILRGGFEETHKNLIDLAKKWNAALMDAEGNLTLLARSLQNIISYSFKLYGTLVKTNNPIVDGLSIWGKLIEKIDRFIDKLDISNNKLEQRLDNQFKLVDAQVKNTKIMGETTRIDETANFARQEFASVGAISEEEVKNKAERTSKLLENLKKQYNELTLSTIKTVEAETKAKLMSKEYAEELQEIADQGGLAQDAVKQLTEVILKYARDIDKLVRENEFKKTMKEQAEIIDEFSRDAGSVWDNYTDVYDKTTQKIKRANISQTESFINVSEEMIKLQDEADTLDAKFMQVYEKSLPKGQREIARVRDEYIKLGTIIDEIARKTNMSQKEAAEWHQKMTQRMQEDIAEVGNKWKETTDGMRDALADFFNWTKDGFLDLQNVFKQTMNAFANEFSKKAANSVMDWLTGTNSGNTFADIFGGTTSSSGTGFSIGDIFSTVSNLFSGNTTGTTQGVGSIFSNLFGKGGSTAAFNSYGLAAGSQYGAYSSYLSSAAPSAFDAYALQGGSLYSGYAGGTSSGAASGAAIGATGWIAIIAAIEMLAQSLNEKSGRNLVNYGGKTYATSFATPGDFSDPFLDLVSGSIYGVDSRHSGGAYASAAAQAGDWEGFLKGITAQFALSGLPGLDPLGDALLGHPVSKWLELDDIERSWLKGSSNINYNALSGKFVNEVNWNKVENKDAAKAIEGLTDWATNWMNIIADNFSESISAFSDDFKEKYSAFLQKFHVDMTLVAGFEDEKEWEEDYERIKTGYIKKIWKFANETVSMYVEGLRDSFDAALGNVPDILSGTAYDSLLQQAESLFTSMAIPRSRKGKDLQAEIAEVTESATSLGLLLEYMHQVNELYLSATSALDLMINPLTAWAKEVGDLNKQVAEWSIALQALGVSTEKLTELDEKRAEVYDFITNKYASEQVAGILSPILANQTAVAGNYANIASEIAFMRSGQSKEDYLLSKINLAKAAGNTLEVSELAQQWYQVAVDAANEQAKVLDNKIKAEQESARLWRDVSEQARSLSYNVGQAILGIKYSALNVSTPNVRTSMAAGDWNSILQGAYRAGDTEALNTATAFASTYLTELQSNLKSSTGYVSGYDTVISQLMDLQRFVAGNEYERALYDEARQDRIATSTEASAADLTEINTQFTSFMAWNDQQNAKQLSLIETTNDILSEIRDANGPMDITVMVGNEEFDTHIDKRADKLIVSAYKNKTGAVSQV